MLVVSCSGDDDANTTLSVTWKFASGDCTSNQVEKVKVTATPQGGAGLGPSEVACSAGSAELGTIAAGTYAVNAEGLDSTGVVRVAATLSASFPNGKVAGPLDITLRPKASNVNVTWNGCPSGIILPYFVTLYKAPASGTSLTNKVQETQASCQARKAALDNVQPGDYVVEVDSRAVTPAVRGTSPVTVVAGQDANVNVAVP